MDEQKDFLGRGWAFPVRLDPLTGRVAEAAYEADIAQSIRIILETAKGERHMRPDFGCGIHDRVFAALDTTTLQIIRSEVEAALRRYEARIEVIAVTFDEEKVAAGILLIEIDYRVRRTNQTGNHVYPFHLREGKT